MKKDYRLYSAACLMLALPDIAGAQTVEPPENQIESIVVTAQRRSQSMQNVPIAVSALSGESALASGITGTSLLQAAVPSLVINRNGAGAAPFIRGIGASNGDGNAEASVATYVDGVYQPSAYGNLFEFSDIERVEVLKGPQGTLFGRNSTGGVIQVITKDPADELEANASVGYANYETVRATSYLSVPLSSDIAFNVSTQYERQNEGWGHNLVSGGEIRGARDFGIRGKLLFTPGDQTQIKLAGSYSSSNNGGLNAQPPEGARTLPFTGSQAYAGRYNVWNDHEFIAKTHNRSVNLQIDHDFGAASAKSITAYIKSSALNAVDADASSSPALSDDFIQSSKMFSQEFHLASLDGSAITWLLGAYYFERTADQTQVVRGLFLAPLANGLDQFGKTKATSESLFFNATVPLAENTNLTGGFRYSWEKSTGTAADFLGGTLISANPLNGLVASFEYEKPTWRLSLDHEFSTDVLGYVSYNRGTKSGNFSVSASTPGLSNPYFPEQLDAYEVGVKSELFDRTARLNVAAFCYDFRDYQFQKTVAGAAIIFNGPTAKAYGGEIEAEYRPTSRLTLNAAVSLLHTRIGDFPGAPNTCRDVVSGNVDTGGFFCDPASGVATTTPFNARGNPLPNAPKITANGSWNYRLPTSIGEFSVSGNVYRFGGAASDLGNRLRYRGYTTFNSSIAWTNPSEALTVRLWAKNLTNDYYYSQLVTVPGIVDFAGPAAPRTYGITLTTSF